MNCQLILSNYDGQYRPGTTIEGKVTCIFPEPEHLTVISVKFSGQENTDWNENTLNGRIPLTPTRFFGFNRIIEKGEILRSAGRIAAGTFEYPFTLELPKTLPSTFKGTYGQISYTLTARVQFLSKIAYRETKKIVIEGPVDLNHVPYTFSKVLSKYSDETHVINLCCVSSGLATLDVYLDKEGYVIGEPIKVTTVVRNKSDSNINYVQVELQRVLMEKATYPKVTAKYDTQILSSQSTAGVLADNTETYNFVVTFHDSVTLHNLCGSNLFKEWFVLTVRAQLVRDLGVLMVKVPLVVGNIPYTTQSSQDNSISHMNVPGRTPYPPTREELGVEATNHMMVPGLTPYPPNPPPLDQNRPPAPQDQERVSTGRTSENVPPPSYHEAVGNPNIYPPPPPA